ncbi:MAG: hypothetical protein PHV18_04310 [Lachnospiraceae bacterium]|nr:hypothetical protein [Lachnospiraceae bacterium]
MEKYQSTPFFLQEALREDIGRMLEGNLFKNPDPAGDPYIPMSIYGQNLPLPVAGTEEPSQAMIDYTDDMISDPVYNCPWCLVKIDSGEVKGPNEPQTVVVAICYGIFNDDRQNDGHKDILNLIQKTYERYATEPTLSRSYRCKQDFEWSVQREDTYPYYFGAISMTFEMTGIKLERSIYT